MDPVSPVFPTSGGCEIVANGPQDEYRPLPIFRTEKSVISRWALTDEERKYIADGGDLYICMMHFGGKILPVLPIAAEPDKALETMLEVEAAF